MATGLGESGEHGKYIIVRWHSCCNFAEDMYNKEQDTFGGVGSREDSSIFNFPPEGVIHFPL